MQKCSIVRLRVAIVVIAVLVGIAAGVGSYTFIYAKGYSYLTNDPAACANCHVMNEYYAAWMKGPHRSVAACNDCHTPHSLIPKYVVKASNGFWHSFYFTTGRYPDHLEIRPSNRRVADKACLHCHSEMTEAIGNQSCIRCHWDVGHMK
ncbi:MAG TPA: cytochrome c nitrite reductase small subunit [Thermoanaerobaculia bacterium]|nr:cytochrome c nitrite reductase small subunit [Thermoanaerobaculia bacterium]